MLMVVFRCSFPRSSNFLRLNFTRLACARGFDLSQLSEAGDLDKVGRPLNFSLCYHMLYAFGSNGSGQLGLGHRIDRSKPERSVFPVDSQGDNPVDIAAGGNHTLVLLRSGKVWSAGSNERAECGQRPQGTSSLTFSGVSIYNEEQKPEKFKACSATWEASALVTSGDMVYTFGSGPKGELGQGELTTESFPRQITGFPPVGLTIVEISSCMGHTVVVLSNGEIYGWGQGRKGQLGEPAGIVWSPRRIPNLPFKAVRAVCGKDFTYIVGPPDTGQHMLLGPDKWSIRSSAPDRVKGWKDVGASWGSIFVLLSDGTLLSWGRNDHGLVSATHLLKLSKIAAGSEHCLGLTAQGEVLAWGWGEHGNCGLPVEPRGGKQQAWNSIDIEGAQERHVTDIWAGCATSWILVDP